MTSKAIKIAFAKVITTHAAAGPHELRRIFAEAMLEWERARGWDEPQRGKPWTDGELIVILSDAPTKDNCLKHARAFGRGYGAIEQIYRWAATSGPEIKRKRPDDAFVHQIKRVSKMLGWRA